MRLGNLGSAYRTLGQMQEAMEHLQQALEISREICAASTEGTPEWAAARRREGEYLSDLGVAYRNLGQVQEAIEHYQQALEISREIGDRRHEGIIWAIWGAPTAPWGRCRRRWSTTSKRWTSPARLATGSWSLSIS